jgi:hypothetical protein
MPRRKKKQKEWEWANSDEKKELVRMFMDEEIGNEEQAIDVFNRVEMFKALTKKNWHSRFTSTKKQVTRKYARKDDDRARLTQSRALFPEQPVDLKGKPRWEGSVAETMLKKDVAEKIHEEYLTGKEFWKSRDSYQRFERGIFLKHIFQEIRTSKMRKKFHYSPYADMDFGFKDDEDIADEEEEEENEPWWVAPELAEYEEDNDGNGDGDDNDE